MRYMGKKRMKKKQRIHEAANKIWLVIVSSWWNDANWFSMYPLHVRLSTSLPLLHPSSPQPNAMHFRIFEYESENSIVWKPFDAMLIVLLTSLHSIRSKHHRIETKIHTAPWRNKKAKRKKKWRKHVCYKCFCIYCIVIKTNKIQCQFSDEFCCWFRNCFR